MSHLQGLQLGWWVVSKIYTLCTSILADTFWELRAPQRPCAASGGGCLLHCQSLTASGRWRWGAGARLSSLGLPRVTPGQAP